MIETLWIDAEIRDGEEILEPEEGSPGPIYLIAWSNPRSPTPEEWAHEGDNLLLTAYIMRGGQMRPLVRRPDSAGELQMGGPGAAPWCLASGRGEWQTARTLLESSWPDVIWRVWSNPHRHPPTASAAQA